MRDVVIMGNVVAAGQGQNVARQVSIRAVIPKETGAYTVNKLCASGMKAMALAAQAIRYEEADIILAGEMVRKDHDLGLATLCIGGGQGMATILEKV